MIGISIIDLTRMRSKLQHDPKILSARLRVDGNSEGVLDRHGDYPRVVGLCLRADRAAIQTDALPSDNHFPQVIPREKEFHRVEFLEQLFKTPVVEVLRGLRVP